MKWSIYLEAQRYVYSVQHRSRMIQVCHGCHVTHCCVPWAPNKASDRLGLKCCKVTDEASIGDDGDTHGKPLEDTVYSYIIRRSMSQLWYIYCQPADRIQDQTSTSSIIQLNSQLGYPTQSFGSNLNNSHWFTACFLLQIFSFSDP